MNNRIIKNNCSLIVSSCDNYKDLWKPYFYLKNKFWGDCPFQTILISETEQMKLPGVRIFNTGKDLSWSQMLKATIIESSSEYVLLSMEDFFFQSKVNTEVILSLYDYVKLKKINMLRLIPRPGPDIKLDIDNIGEISPKADYRVSGQAAFWKSKTLINLLEDRESLWQFEINATKRSLSYEKFYCVYKPVLTYKHHVVERGKWFIWSALKFKFMGLPLDFKSRKIMSVYETFAWLLHKYISPYLIYLNPEIKSKLKPFLKKTKIIP
tara:strand:- start:1268 stop:2068 length:801 start_codon:yes stop_codon:yes gene_type:complete